MVAPWWELLMGVTEPVLASASSTAFYNHSSSRTHPTREHTPQKSLAVGRFKPFKNFVMVQGDPGAVLEIKQTYSAFFESARYA